LPVDVPLKHPRLRVEKGIFTKEEFLEMVKEVDGKMNRKRIF
jgi:hypothetical protein